MWRLACSREDAPVVQAARARKLRNRIRKPSDRRGGAFGNAYPRDAGSPRARSDRVFGNGP